MKGVNKVILLGNVGRDPEVRLTQGGNSVATLSVATSESWHDKQSGDKKEATEWHRVVAFGRLAEIVGEYVRKGSKVYVEGSIRAREYEKDGQKHWMTEIIAREVLLLDGTRIGYEESPAAPKIGGYVSPQARSAAPAPAPRTPGQRARQAAVELDDDSEIPF